MPVILPTPDEIARMDWREREKAMLRARRTMAALRQAETEVERVLDQTWNDAREGWAEEVRTVATQLAHQMGVDPNAPAHRMALLEAM